jgi:hypothetical protein
MEVASRRVFVGVKEVGERAMMKPTIEEPYWVWE